MLPNLSALRLGAPTGVGVQGVQGEKRPGQGPAPGQPSASRQRAATTYDADLNPVDRDALFRERNRALEQEEARARARARVQAAVNAAAANAAADAAAAGPSSMDVCPAPAPEVPPAVQPVDEGSAGPIYPAGASEALGVDVVEVPIVQHVPSDDAVPAAGSRLPMIKARYIRDEPSVYAAANPDDAEELKPGDRWCPRALTDALAARENGANPTNYHARPEQLYPINDAKSMGVAVYEVLNNADKVNGEVAQWRASLAASVNAAPEFKPVTPTEADPRTLFERQDIKLAVGGFAALAHASSFHNEFARALRFRAEKYVVENDIFGLGANGVNEGKKLEQVVDRTMVRRPGQKPTAEAWHRDIARGTLEGDEVFGGWINLDTENNQYFSCVPGSAHDRPAAGVDYESGFAKIGKSSHPRVVSRSYRIVIPPGHMMVFNERTIHEVAPVECQGRSSCRLFFGWRITAPNNNTPLFFDLERRLAEQDGMPLKSGQHKHAYSDPKCGGRYKEMGDFDARLLFDATTNTLGFKNYPGGPPMYPSSYWGQQEPEKPAKFCANLRPCLLKMRYFNPSVYVRDEDGNIVPDKEGKPKTRNAKSSDLESVLRGTRFLERKKKRQAGVLCNFDLKWNDGQNGQRTQWSYGIKEPLKPDTVRSLTETARLLRADPEGGRVQWAQPAYAPHEIEILKPHTLEELRAIVSAHPQRALPVRAFPAAERAADTPGM